MENIKASKYNYYTLNDEGCLLVYNSLNYEFVKIPKEKSTWVKQYLESRESFEIVDILNELSQKGIFVPESCDEIEIVHDKFVECINNEGMLQLLVVLTENCNMRCPYCFEEHKNHRMLKEVQESIVTFVKRNISKYRGLYVMWFGGEPLLEIDMLEEMSKQFIEICNVYKKTYLAGISSNGYYLTLDNMKRLVDCNVVSLQITVDGVGDTHDKFRVDKNGSGTFQTIIENLCDIKENMKYGVFNIDIRTNYTKEIFEKKDEFIALLKNNFSGDSRFRVLPRTAVDLGGNAINKIREELINDHFKSEHSLYSELAKNASELNFGAIKLQLAPGNGVCYAMKKNYYGIDPDGYVFRCSDTFQNHPEHRIGFLKKGIMNIDKYKEIKWIKSWESISNACKECYMFPICFGGGCSLQRYKEKYLGELPREKCQYEKKSIDIILRLLDRAGEFVTIG